MSSRLDGTVALVTGASSGIGAATATALAAEGASVALLARRLDKLAEIADSIGDRARAYEADVTDPASVQAVVAQVVADLGGIDILVNNAGWLANTSALEADLADWHRMVDVNLNGVLTATHTALPHVVRAATGPRGVADVVTISSIAGRRVPGPYSNVYSATKHAVVAFSEALRQEFAASGVRIGVIEPGLVRTEMTTTDQPGAPDGANGEPLLPEDIAETIVFMVTRPARMAVNELLTRPTEQVR